MASGFDYDEVWDSAQAELEELQKGKDIAERTLAEINMRIEAVAAVVRAVEPMVGRQPPLFGILSPEGASLESLVEMAGEYRVTSNIRLVLRSADAGLSAPEIRAALQSSGWDVSSYSNPLAFIHTVLRRLVEADEIEELPAVEGTKKYRWIGAENQKEKPETPVPAVSPRKRVAAGKVATVSRGQH
jgi:hypothetical protein